MIVINGRAFHSRFLRGLPLGNPNHDEQGRFSSGGGGGGSAPGVAAEHADSENAHSNAADHHNIQSSLAEEKGDQELADAHYHAEQAHKKAASAMQAAGVRGYAKGGSMKESGTARAESKAANSMGVHGVRHTS